MPVKTRLLFSLALLCLPVRIAFAAGEAGSESAQTSAPACWAQYDQFTAQIVQNGKEYSAALNRAGNSYNDIAAGPCCAAENKGLPQGLCTTSPSAAPALEAWYCAKQEQKRAFQMCMAKLAALSPANSVMRKSLQETLKTIGIPRKTFDDALRLFSAIELLDKARFYVKAKRDTSELQGAFDKQLLNTKLFTTALGPVAGELVKHNLASLRIAQDSVQAEFNRCLVPVDRLVMDLDLSQ